MVLKFCKQCSVPFSQPRAKYCSVACRRDGEYERAQQKNGDRECGFCHSVFQPVKIRSLACSASCGAKMARTTTRMRKTPELCGDLDAMIESLRRIPIAKRTQIERDQLARYADVAYLRQYRASQTEKNRAHRAIERAVATGSIVKPANCELCQDEPKCIHGHHHDYSQPLNVTWVCPPCHGGIHASMRASR